jgi:hypothetical protein
MTGTIGLDFEINLTVRAWRGVIAIERTVRAKRR